MSDPAEPSGAPVDDVGWARLDVDRAARTGDPEVVFGPGKTPEEKAAEAEREKAYKETLKKIPDSKASNDPWGGMRSDPPKQPAPKASAATTGAPKKKSGTAAN